MTTLVPAPRFGASIAHGRLLRMLQSMQRNFPRTKVWKRRGGFGVSMDDGTFLRIQCSDTLTDDQLRAWLGLFAGWLSVDPAALRNPGERSEN
jgi:hypothetical protein